MDLLNGHPYLTSKALYALVSEQWTWANLIRMAPTDQGPFADHLRHYHWLLRDEPSLKEALKQIIRNAYCTDERVFYRLMRAGLVRGTIENCACRCGLYKMYFQEKL
jgi:hypothetical protein